MSLGNSERAWTYQEYVEQYEKLKLAFEERCRVIKMQLKDKEQLQAENDRLGAELMLCASRNTKAIKALLSERNELLRAVQLVYRKHCMGYDGIGWDELGGVLLDALCNTMGAEDYEEWKSSLKGGE